MTAQCDAGYYCSGGAFISAPTDQVTGDICPPGSYCPVGTGVPQPCPLGTFSSQSGNQAVSACEQCTSGEYRGACLRVNSVHQVSTEVHAHCRIFKQFVCLCESVCVTTVCCSAGKHCSDVGLTAVSGDCDGGYYCPGGQETATPATHQCTLGHYCPVGSLEQVPCPAGEYQDQPTQVLAYTSVSGQSCTQSNTMLNDFIWLLSNNLFCFLFYFNFCSCSTFHNTCSCDSRFTSRYVRHARLGTTVNRELRLLLFALKDTTVKQEPLLL